MKEEKHQAASPLKIGRFKIAAALILTFCLATNLVRAENNNIQTLTELRQTLTNYLAQPRFDGALWGVKIISLDSGLTLFESHADRLMSPASNCKLFTGALALDKFGGDYKISTPIYATTKPDNSGTINGNLIVAGHGDTTFNDRWYGTNFWSIFEPFVTALQRAGVKRVTGDIIGDATYFHGEPTGGSMMIDDFEDGECPYISALTLNDGLAQVHVTPGATVGAPCQLTMLQPDANLVFSNLTVTVAGKGVHHIEYYMPFGEKIIYIIGQLPLGDHDERLDIPDLDPAKWFAAALKDALARHGIEIAGQARGVIWPQNSVLNPQDVKIGEVLSPPLRDIIRLYMKPSQNLENDTVLADVGEATRTASTPSWRTSEELGLAALHQFLDANDLPSSEVHFNEGSGLSTDNMTTANAFVELLQFMWRHSAALDFVNALPIAGKDGTLIHRLRGTAAAGNLRAKTGSLWWTRSLSGYVTSAAGEHLAFSLLLNRYEPPADRSSRQDLDDISVMLANFSGRSTGEPATLEKTYAPLGQLILTQFVSAPFPHPARANGHWYHNQFFSAADHYSDSTVAMFIPKHFQVSDKIDFVVHFHGWRHTVGGTLPEYKLIEQFAASGKNAILIVPQGPYNVPDSFDGKLCDTNGFKNFMNEAVEKLRTSGALGQTNFELGNIIISGHSGGYGAMMAITDHGGLEDKIREIWLFDALYAGRENFVAWQKAEDGRLVDIYTDHGGTEGETTNLMTSLKASGVPYFLSEDTNATPDELRTNKIVILHTDLIHNDVPAKREAFEEFLKTSCLQND